MHSLMIYKMLQNVKSKYFPTLRSYFTISLSFCDCSVVFPKLFMIDENVIIMVANGMVILYYIVWHCGIAEHEGLSESSWKNTY